jgi:PAS domain S-box-containing protein
MLKKKNSKTLSFKRYFTLAEAISIFFIITLLVISTFFSFNKLSKSIIENQSNFLGLFSDELEYLKNHAIEHLKSINIENDVNAFAKFAPDEYKEIFIINQNHEVVKIFRKVKNSIIFDGFSFNNTSLKDYIEKNKGFAIFTTDILRTIDDKISFYIIKILNENRYLVSEINLSDLINFVPYQIKKENTYFVITNSNNYIFFSSNKKLNSFFINNIKFNHLIFIEKRLYLISKINPVSFNNSFYLLEDFFTAFSAVINNIILYIILILFAFLFLILKNILNNKYFISPLTKLSNIITNWRISELENDMPKFFLGFEEIANLTNTLIKKYFEFSNEYEQLQDAERTIRKMQKYLKNLIDSLPSAIISIDLEGNVIEWNKKTEEMTGIKKEESIGKKYSEIFPYLSKFKDNIKDVISSEKVKIFDKEILSLKEEKIVNVNIIPIAQNGLSGVAFRIDDITEIENLERQIRQSQKMEVVGLLAGGIAHDFNNVLTGIISSISLIKELINENPSLKNAELIDYIDILENSSNKAKDIVQKILTISSKKDEKLLPINLKTCLNDVERICKSSIEKSVELKFINPFSEAIILGDQNLIVQALLNLCINASHAMTIMRKPGEKIGGTLTLKLEIANEQDPFFKKIKENYAKKEEVEQDFNAKDFWKITVGDNGVGIPSEIQDKIFEPFFTTKQAFYGSGIGLSTVKMIVDQHNGFITFDSQEGKGTSFYLYLPILKVEKFLETESKQESIKKGNGLILLVDDEHIVRTITKAMLIKLGFTVLLATNGDEAIEIFNRYNKKIKLIILDIAMPGKSGIDIFKEIKIKDNLAKILFITGLKIDENIKKIVENEADGFLAKPFTINQISNKIYEILSKKV